MRRLINHNKQQVKSVYCNLCGKQIKIEKGIITEGVATVEQHWGYFSEKDGQTHSFDLCEKCYDMLTEKFVLPVAVTNEKELI